MATASRRDAGGKARFSGDHMGGMLMARRPSARGRGGRHLPKGSSSSEGAAGLNVTRGPLETSGAFVEGAVDVNVPKFPALRSEERRVGKECA